MNSEWRFGDGLLSKHSEKHEVILSNLGGNTQQEERRNKGKTEKYLEGL